MNKRKRIKYVHEGRYVAEVDVELLEDDTAWSPYLTVEDACRLDDVREALRLRRYPGRFEPRASLQIRACRSVALTSVVIVFD